MDENTFKARLASDGYSQIETNVLSPRPLNAEHAHDHDIRGLVLDGVFIVRKNNKPVSYQPDEIFEVSSGIKHAEQVGPDGAHVIVGRKWATQNPKS